MRLLKLAALALFGYALYEFCRGLLQDSASGTIGRSSEGGGRSGEFAANQALGQNISGPGEGTDEATLESDGGSVRHKVGRGVIPSRYR
jgi:hypothetical protein